MNTFVAFQMQISKTASRHTSHTLAEQVGLNQMLILSETNSVKRNIHLSKASSIAIDILCCIHTDAEDGNVPAKPSRRLRPWQSSDPR